MLAALLWLDALVKADVGCQCLALERVKARGCIGARAAAFVEMEGVHSYAVSCSASSGLVAPPAATLRTCV